MAASAKQLAITLFLIGLMAGSLCAEAIDGETLNRQEQENVPTSSRRLLLPRPNNIYHPAPPEPASPIQNYAPTPSPAPPASPMQNYAPPASPAPPAPSAPPASPMQNYAPPASPAPPAPPAPPAKQLNQDDYKSVDCGDRLCAGIWIGRRVFVLKYE